MALYCVYAVVKKRNHNLHTKNRDRCEAKALKRSLFSVNKYDVQGAVYEVTDHFRIERSTAYNRKNRALARLQVLLFGKS